jgi:hypothetical protein
MWTGYCLSIAANAFVQDIVLYQLSATSPVDLRAVMVALKVIGIRQNMSNWFLEKVESDISQARIGKLKPQDSRTLECIPP